jgi:hypothetical protein
MCKRIPPNRNYHLDCNDILIGTSPLSDSGERGPALADILEISTWKYPMSLKKWISFLGRNRDAAIEWTGASPQRYVNRVNMELLRRRIRLLYLSGQSMLGNSRFAID